MDYLISDMWEYFMTTVSGTLEYKALIVVGMLLALLVLVVPGRKVSDRVAFAALAAYLTLVFASTVLLRTTAHGSGISLVPFSSYREAFIVGNRSLAFEILENIVLFMPAGLALGYLCRNSGTGASLLAIAGTAMFSVGIEFLQYVYGVGVLEFDDLFNNTLGIIIGFVIARLLCAPFTSRKKDSKSGADGAQGAKREWNNSPRANAGSARQAPVAAPRQARVAAPRKAPAATPRQTPAEAAWQAPAAPTQQVPVAGSTPGNGYASAPDSQAGNAPYEPSFPGGPFTPRDAYPEDIDYSAGEPYGPNHTRKLNL